MRASDFRAAARRALSGKWPLAILAGLIAGLLGGASPAGIDLNVTYQEGSAQASAQVGALNITASGVALFSYTLVLVLAMAILLYILGSVINLGYTRFNLDLVDGKDIQLGSLFNYFPWFKTALLTRLLVGLYVGLLSLLLVIPGIIAIYSYALTSYILADDPTLTARQAMARSKELMRGNRWRMFCLDFSFIGWELLSSLTLGLGSLLLNPYKSAATATFYRDLLNPQSDPLLKDI